MCTSTSYHRLSVSFLVDGWCALYRDDLEQTCRRTHIKANALCKIKFYIMIFIATRRIKQEGG